MPIKSLAKNYSPKNSTIGLQTHNIENCDRGKVFVQADDRVYL